jgi:hypothetical protein
MEEMKMITTNTKIAIAAALLLGSASAGLANDIETNSIRAQSVREWNEYVGQTTRHMAGASYGYASPSQQEDFAQPSRKGRSR